MSNCCQPLHPLSPTQCCDSSFSDNTQYFETVEELRQYIIDREANRKLEDLVNVESGIGSYDEGTILFFDPNTNIWTLADSFAPLTW